MGFWTWLTGKKSSVTATDRIWLTKAARWRGLCRELFEHLSNAQPFKSLGATGGGQDLKTKFAEGSTDDLNVRLLIIDDQQTSSIYFS